MRPCGKLNFHLLTIYLCPAQFNFPKGDHFFALILSEKARVKRRKSLIMGKSIPRCFFKKQGTDNGQRHHCTALGTFPVAVI